MTATTATPPDRALVPYKGEGLDRARGWVSLDKDERRRRATAAAQEHDVEALLDLADVWLTLHGKRGSSTSALTRSTYRGSLRALLATWAHENLLSVDGDTAALWIESLAGKGGAPAKPLTRTRHLAAARSLYAALRWARATTADPFGQTRISPDPTPRWDKRAPYEDEAVRRLVNVATGDDRALVLLGAHAGLRVSEMLALRWDDIDLPAKVLAVRHGKGGKRRTVALSRSLVEALDDVRHYGERVIGERADYVLPYTTSISAWRRLNLVCARAGVAPLGLHSLRHSAGTRVYSETKSLEDAARHLGHASIETARVYARWDDKKLKSTVGDW